MFAPLAFCPLGWALLEVWLLDAHARLVAHMIVTLPAVIIVGVSILRYRRWHKYSYPPLSQGTHVPRAKDAASALLLLFVGAILGVLILQASTVLLFAAAAGMIFLPWSRLPSCRGRLVLACLLVWVGSGIALAVGPQAISRMFMLLAAWVFLSTSCISLVLHLLQVRRAENRMTILATDIEHA